MSDLDRAPQKSGESTPPKKRYEKPTLENLGSLTEITRAGAGVNRKDNPHNSAQKT